MNAEDTRKRKMPPKFQHLPGPQAAKAKLAWINKAKMRSNWAKEKRRMSKQSGQLEPFDSDHQNTKDPEVTIDEERVEESDQEPPRKRIKHSSETIPIKKQNEAKKTTESQEETLRDLTRRAYAPESLHTFKSDPLRRRKGQAGKRGTTGRGQPNMKLRMNALLERIKQNVGTE